VCPKISGFGMPNNGKVKNESACANKNTDLLKKISLMGTEFAFRTQLYAASRGLFATIQDHFLLIRHKQLELYFQIKDF